MNELENFSKRSTITVEETEILFKYLKLIQIPEENSYQFYDQNVNVTYKVFDLIFLSINSSILEVNYKYVAKYKIFYTLLFLTGSKVKDLSELTKEDLETILLTKKFYWKNYKIDFNETELELLLRIQEEISIHFSTYKYLGSSNKNCKGIGNMATLMDALNKNLKTIQLFLLSSDLKEAPLTTYSFKYSFIKRKLGSYSLKEIEYMLDCKLHNYIYLR